MKKTLYFYRSLSMRIIFLTAFCVLLPFWIHTLFLSVRFRQASIHSALSQLDTALVSNLRLFDFWRKELFLSPLPDTAWLSLNPSSGICLHASSSEWVGSSSFASLFSQEILLQTQGPLPFALSALSPKDQTPLLILAQQQEGILRLVLLPLKKLDSLFQPNAEGFVTFIKTKQTLIWSNAASSFAFLDAEKVKDWGAKDHFLDLFTLSKKNIAVSSPIEQSTLILATGLSAEGLASLEHFSPFSYLLHFFSFLILSGLLFSLLFLRKMTTPIEQLTSVMQKASEGDMEIRYIKEKFGFEINALGEQLNHMFSALLTHARVSQEIALASELQQALLPKTLPQIEGVEMGGYCLAAKDIAGDFYDLYPLSPSSLFVTIADTAGKGVSACLYSLIVRSLLRGEISNQENNQGEFTKETLSAALIKTNALFCKDTGDSGNFTTLWSGVYDIAREELLYASCGHLPALLLDKSGHLQELPSQGHPMGATSVMHIEMKKVPFPRGSLLFLYTDGVTEAENKEGLFFGKERLYTFLKKHGLSLPPEKLIVLLLEEVRLFCSPGEPQDDLTLVCLKKS